MKSTKKTYKIILLTILLLPHSTYLNGKEIVSISTTESLVRDSENILLEHALMDYNYYLPDTCEPPIFHLTLDPYFRQLSYSKDVLKIKSHELAGFLQAQLNWSNFWIRSNIIFGKIKENISILKNKKSIAGVDDLTIKLGYTYYNDGCTYFGGQLLAQVPTNREIKSALTLVSTTQDRQNKYALTFDAPQIGSRNLILGGGFYGGYTIYKSTESSLSILGELQCRCALKTTLTTQMEMPDATTTFTMTGQEKTLNIKQNTEKQENTQQNKDQTNQENLIIKPNKEASNTYQTLVVQKEEVQQILQPQNTQSVNVAFSPGHAIDFWVALHYNWCDFNIELGSTFSTTFKDHLDTKNVPTISVENITAILKEKNSSIKSKTLPTTINKTVTTTSAQTSTEKTQEINTTQNNLSTENNQSTNLSKTEEIENNANFSVTLKPTDTLINKNYYITRFSAKPYIAISYNTTAYDNPLKIGLGLGYQYDSFDNKNTTDSLNGFLIWGTVTLNF
jgi:hypothetical protein